MPDTEAEADTDTDSVDTDDRFRHIRWGYYWDTNAITIWKLLVTVSALIAYPPIGAFLFGWFSVMAITADPEEHQEDGE